MRYKISHALVQFGGDVILRDVNFWLFNILIFVHVHACQRPLNISQSHLIVILVKYNVT